MQRPRRLLATALGAALLAAPAAPSALGGQSGPTLRPTHEQDASILAPGVMRLRSTTAWSRWDAIAGPDGTRPLGAPLSFEELGTSFPGIATVQQALRDVTGDATLEVSLGRATTRANTRTVVTPVVLEVGIMRRVQLSAALTIVQARTNVSPVLEASAGRNLGINPAIGNSTHLGTNAQVVSQLTQGSLALQQRLARCRSFPAEPGCDQVLADEAAVEQLIAATSTTAARIGTVYGSSSTAPGAAMVPLASSDLQAAVNARLAQLDAGLVQYLGAGNGVAARPVGALGPAGANDLLGFLTASGDTVTSHKRYGLGDMELGAAVQLIDRWGGAQPQALRTRAALHSVVRLPTGLPARRGVYFDIGTGDGQPDIEGALLADVLVRDAVGLTASVRHTQQLGRARAGRASLLYAFDDVLGAEPPTERSLGSVTQLALTPRWVFMRALSVEGHYGLIARGDDRFFTRDDATGIETERSGGGGAEHRAGFGIRFSSLLGARPGRTPRLPFEIAFLHLQTVSASGAPVPRIRRDQLQLNVYYQLWGR
jgi:hypothetical protein